MPDQLLLAIAFGLTVSFASYVVRFLTLDGAIATFILALVVFGIGGWQWTVPMLTFFLTSSVLSKYGRRRKQEFDSVFAKSGTRDWGQVGANGGVAGALVVCSAFFPSVDIYPFYLGAVAAVTADTWGTEIGLLSGGRTVSILTLRPVERGTSGGVSAAGVLGGIVGAMLIALSGYFWYPNLLAAALIVVAGILGSFVDSVLGATIQGQYQCGVCRKTTERTNHCGQRADRIRGLTWVNNDVVNCVCAVSGAAAVWALASV